MIAIQAEACPVRCTHPVDAVALFGRRAVAQRRGVNARLVVRDTRRILIFLKPFDALTIEWRRTKSILTIGTGADDLRVIFQLIAADTLLVVQTMALAVDLHAILAAMAFVRPQLVGHHITAVALAHIRLRALGIPARQLADRLALVLRPVGQAIILEADALLGRAAFAVRATGRTMRNAKVFDFVQIVASVTYACSRCDTVAVVAATQTCGHTLNGRRFPHIASVALADLGR